ncbi:MAG TPA: DUF98 domain-containing protein, partial [Methanomicrobiales archaeon]|nr:DUF98 domain-containing protein [Methanomicrobiales archaeon]
PIVRSLISGLCDAGAACAGMSSFGPTVYAISDSGMRQVEKGAREILSGVGGDVLLTRARNTGVFVRME